LRPILEQVSERFGEASYAVVREGLLSHCIAKQTGTLPMRFEEVQVGTRQPLGVGAAGLALLSALSKSRADAIVSANAKALFPFGGMTAERMQLLVRATRERGWSVVGTHVSKKVLAVGVAVRNRQGEPIAAISVASTLERMPAERQKLIAAGIRAEIKASLPHGI
jgi:DNA-binding IclR family transcriptional regulator